MNPSSVRVIPAGSIRFKALYYPEKPQHVSLLRATHDAGVMTRPIWTLMNRLPMFAGCLRGDLSTAEWLEARVVNLPCSVGSHDAAQ